MSKKIVGSTVTTPLNPVKVGKNGATVEEVLAAVPAANSVKTAQAEDGTVTITMPMSDGTTDVCVLNPGEDGWPVSATLNGVVISLTWEGW